jgi:cell division protein FtsW (lipid II flippase)
MLDDPALLPAIGQRQALWVGVALAILTVGLRLPPDLGFLRRYRYVWLTGSLALTAAALLMGVNPMGYGPRMWLGCCGVYLQPSEPLKLLLIAYLAAYMADRQPFLALRPSTENTNAPAAAPHPGYDWPGVGS